MRLVHSVSTRFISFAIGVTGLSLMCLLPEREPGVTHPRAMRKLVALLAVNAGSLLGVIVAVRIVNWKVRTYPVNQYEASLRGEDESSGTLGERSQPMDASECVGCAVTRNGDWSDGFECSHWLCCYDM
ncbi:hypothetical protein BCR44DRAFT_1452880, partial [Catenaria anguillulae PL171]